MRFRLRTLLILLVVGPVVLAGLWCAYITPSLPDRGILPPQPVVRPGLNVAGLVIFVALPLIVLAARRFLNRQH
jgi:hypothetical protein